MKKNIKILGHEISVKKSKKQSDEVKSLLSHLKIFKDAKLETDLKIIQNENWFKLNYWQYIKGSASTELAPSTSFLLNSIWNKHADAMDNMPEAVFIEREQDDKPEADTLTKIVPLILEKCDFEKTYSDAWWYKLKQGSCMYGIFWDSQKENGLGDVSIKKIDMLRVYYEPFIDNIQDSKYIFILSLVDTNKLMQKYPDTNISSNAQDFKTQGYFSNLDSISLDGKSCVIDCYERGINNEGENVVHLTQIVGESIIYSTKNDPLYLQKGLYAHGMYPFVVDTLIPVENSIFGMSMVDICKGVQASIDKLDYIIERNSYISGKPKWIYKKSCGINIDQLKDLSNDFVEASGNIGEDTLRQFQTQPIPSQIINYRQEKINELKEISATREFNQGGTLRGVTAVGAITALQEAGSKLSRDTIKGSFSAFKSIVYMVVELIREFYQEDRNFNLPLQNSNQYISYNNKKLGLLEIKSPTNSNELEKQFRKAIFDIKIEPQRKNAVNTAKHNELILSLFKEGAFDNNKKDQTIIALKSMYLDSKDSLIKILEGN